MLFLHVFCDSYFLLKNLSIHLILHCSKYLFHIDPVCQCLASKCFLMFLFTLKFLHKNGSIKWIHVNINGEIFYSQQCIVQEVVNYLIIKQKLLPLATNEATYLTSLPPCGQQSALQPAPLPDAMFFFSWQVAGYFSQPQSRIFSTSHTTRAYVLPYS